MNIFYYFKEFKKYIIYNIIFVILILYINFIYFDEILYILLKPLLNSLNLHKNFIKPYLIFTNLTEILFIYVKIYLLSFFYFYFPCFILQLNKFLFDGLYKSEKQFLKFFSYFILIFFFFNNILIYFIFIPTIWHFFLNFEILSNSNLFNLYFEGKFNEYLNLIFILTTNINFCLHFPLILVICLLNNLIQLTTIINYRKFFYFFLLILSAILAPPDIFSQIFIIFFLYIFYELSIILILIYVNYQKVL